ncbi:abhydrolase domain-containing 8 [Brachionus plicatilis]|uniref:acylglycerol lipase n=1 Tax=Brachionus plicatilis TaxID=10195 RepID=A0A3M7RDX4_BRAPC|nr:abhydrolase domain-containing 8 [Brachionus plicatilis]
MICCEAPTQILPEDYHFKNGHSKLIKVKDGVEIHLIHVNEGNLSQAQPSVITEQVKRVNFNEPIIEPNKEKSANISNLRDNFLNLHFENFSSMIQSDMFDRKSEKNILYLNGSNKYGLTIMYKKPFSKLLTDESISPKSTIFFIHGVGGNSLVWKHQLKYFAEQNYEMIAIDLIGHGKSTKSKVFSHYEFIEICSHIRAVFDLFAKKNNIIIGHSYGSSFAVNLSQERRDLVQKVVLISGGMPYPLNYINPALNTPLILFKLMKPFIDCHFFCSAFSPDFKEKNNDMFHISAESLFYTMKGQHWQPNYSRTDYFKNQKVLLIEGSDDKFVPFQDAFEMMKSLDKGYLIRIERGSHMVILEEPDILNKLINLFINDT